MGRGFKKRKKESEARREGENREKGHCDERKKEISYSLHINSQSNLH